MMVILVLEIIGNLDESSMKEFNMPGLHDPDKGYKNTSTGFISRPT